MAEPLLARYIDRIKKTFPELVIREAALNADGLVNDVVIINQERVFRFAKADWGQAALAKEAKILKLVRQYVDMPVPHFDHRTEDFVTYPLIPGEILHREDIFNAAKTIQDRLAGQIAVFLRQLHTIPLPALEQHDIPASEAVRRYEDYRQFFDEVQRQVFPLLMSDGKDWIKRHFKLMLANRSRLDYRLALIHGDLASYHIIYDRQAQQINGVIDFGVAGRGDPANDFGLIINMFGESFLRRMARFYPAIEQSIERARFMAGVLELEWVLQGIRSGDLSWFTVHLGRARDVMPVGSGWR